jgi:tellurite resistance protein
MADALRRQIEALEVQNLSLQKSKAVADQERLELQRTASELIEQVKKQTEAKDFMIDRRMINTFLVQYANPKSDTRTK